MLLRAGNETIFLVIGWDLPKTGKRFSVETSYPTPAFFPTFSRHVAARLTQALHVPLENELEGKVYAPGEPPAKWLDPKSVTIRMVWRRYCTAQ